MEIGKEQIKEYLEKYNIKNKEDLVKHIEELKRNTIPNTKLISELVYVLEDDYFFRAPHTMEDFLSFPKLKNEGIKQNVEGEKSTWEFLKPMFEEVHVHKQTVNGIESYSKPLYEEPDVYKDTKNAIESLAYKETEGIKESNGKVDYSEINLEILDLMAERFTANKHRYPKGNMKKTIDIKSLEWALFRHVKKMIQPIETDEETYKDHLSAVLCNASMILDQLKIK